MYRLKSPILFKIFFLLLFSLLFSQGRAESLLCKNLFHVTLYNESTLQILAQRALTLSEQLASTPPSLLSLSEKLLRLELKQVHKKMLIYLPPPFSHPGALFVQGYFTPEFYWQTTVNMRSGGLQTKAPFLTHAQREDRRFIWTAGGVVHASSGEKIDAAVSGDFVIGLDQQIYIADNSTDLPRFFRHSSFFAGGPVLFAGHIQILPNGVISNLSRSSGHYRPSRAHFLWAIDFLSASGFAVVSFYPDIFD